MKKTLLILGIAILTLTGCEKSPTYEQCSVGTIVYHNDGAKYKPNADKMDFIIRNNCSGNKQVYKVPYDSIFVVIEFIGSEITLDKPW